MNTQDTSGTSGRSATGDVAAFTPGPWRYVSDSKEASFGPKLGAPLALVDAGGDCCIDCTESGVDFAQGCANAQLIASAPDLFAVLNEIDKRLRECMSNPNISAAEAYDSFYQELVGDALAQARGQA